MLPAVTGTTRLPAAIVLDIEGTVAPISFVTEVPSSTPHCLQAPLLLVQRNW